MYYIQKKARKNSRSFSKTIKEMETIKEVLEYIKENNLTVTEYPYMFTYIPLSDDTIITQTVMNLNCSPVKLREAIVNQ